MFEFLLELYANEEKKFLSNPEAYKSEAKAELYLAKTKDRKADRAGGYQVAYLVSLAIITMVANYDSAPFVINSKNLPSSKLNLSDCFRSGSFWIHSFYIDE